MRTSDAVRLGASGEAWLFMLAWLASGCSAASQSDDTTGAAEGGADSTAPSYTDSASSADGDAASTRSPEGGGNADTGGGGADGGDDGGGGDAGGDDGSVAGDASDAGSDAATIATIGVDPPMGWSSWSFIRKNPTEATIKAQAQAMHDSGLSAHGWLFVNIDDFYYLNPKTTVDMYGRWVVDTARFPSGMAAMADFVHGLGLRFGMYLTPGIPVAAVMQNTPIEGTQAHAADIADTTKTEKNYNFGAGSMYYIDYTKAGSQAFIDSWAKLLASYGVDYLKIDGVGAADIPDVQAWSKALKNSGRTIHFELSNNLPIADATTWASLANGWRVSGDIECYCSTTSYPLTSWARASSRFGMAASWQPYSAPNARNDLDSLELGNAANDGLTADERMSVMSLWSLAAAPLILGSDLTHLDPADLSLMTNDDVIAVNQAGVAAKQAKGGNLQEWIAKEPDGSYAVGLFNLGTAAAAMTLNWSDLGLSGSAQVRDLWARKDLGMMSGSYQTMVPSHGVALLRVTP
jgi:hypothetical protein